MIRWRRVAIAEFLAENTIYVAVIRDSNPLLQVYLHSMLQFFQPGGAKTGAALKIPASF